MISIRGRFGGRVLVHEPTGTHYFRLYETGNGDVSVIATPALAEAIDGRQGLVRIFGICDPRPFATLKAAHGLDITAEVMVLGEGFRPEAKIEPEGREFHFGAEHVFAHRGFPFPETIEVGAKGRNGWINQSGLSVMAWRARSGNARSDYLHIEALNSQGRGGAAIVSVHGAVIGELAAMLAEAHASALSPEGKRAFVAEMARRMGVGPGDLEPARIVEVGDLVPEPGPLPRQPGQLA